MATPDAGIEALNAAVIAANVNNDLQAMLDLYCDDSYLIVAETGILHGKKSYGKVLAAIIGQCDRIEIETADRVISGDTCTEIGTCISYINDKEAERGLYTVMAIKEKGKWKIKYDTYMTQKVTGTE